MVLKGRYSTTPETLPTIILGLQNRSVISVVSGNYHLGALTSSGTLLTWGKYSNGALGLGDPGKLPAGSPGGFAKEEQRVRARSYILPPDVSVPTEVRFDHGLEAKGRVRTYCFAAAAGAYNTAALVVDLAEDEVPPEGLEDNFQAALHGVYLSMVMILGFEPRVPLIQPPRPITTSTLIVTCGKRKT